MIDLRPSTRSSVRFPVPYRPAGASSSGAAPGSDLGTRGSGLSGSRPIVDRYGIGVRSSGRPATLDGRRPTVRPDASRPTGSASLGVRGNLGVRSNGGVRGPSTGYPGLAPARPTTSPPDARPGTRPGVRPGSGPRGGPATTGGLRPADGIRPARPGTRPGQGAGGRPGVTTYGGGLGQVGSLSPTKIRDVRGAGEAIATAQTYAWAAGTVAAGGLYGFGFLDGCRPRISSNFGYCGPWGYGNWGGSIHFGFSSFWRNGYCYPWWWGSYLSCWVPYWSVSYYPYYRSYASCATRVVYQTIYEQPYETVTVVEQAPVAEPVGEAVAVANPSPTISIAADRYLTLGDQAFRDGRYTDSVQFYAKAVEFAPEHGALYLVLSDALFAAGDYHYAAYAVRRAFELEPELVRGVVDKHAFYPDPADFDRQLAVLELYLEDHPSDQDARLVLGLNYLFGGRPLAAVELFEASAAAPLANDAASAAILSTAREFADGR